MRDALLTLAFRIALRAYPQAVRERFGGEALEAFQRGLAGRGGSEDGTTVWGYGLRAVIDAALDGMGERRRLAALRREGRMTEFLGEVRQATRRLIRAPGFTLAVVVLLGLGVGANAAVFSVLRATVLVPPPWPEVDRIVLPRMAEVAANRADTTEMYWSWRKFVELREATPDLWAGLAGYALRSATVTEPGRATNLSFEFATEDYFSVLGQRPALGRFFVPEDHVDGGATGAIVLSHSFWLSRFGADPEVLGRAVVADGRRMTVVGVAEPGFNGVTGAANWWAPVVSARETFGAWMLDNRGASWMHAIGLLRPEVSISEAIERARPVMEAIDAVESYLEPGESVHVAMRPLRSSWSHPATRRSLWMTMGAAGTVLLIAISNVGALMLARARRGASETAVRLAMGAGRGRLVRERLVEGLLLSVSGGVAGLALAGASMDAIRAAIPQSLRSGTVGDLGAVGGGAIALDTSVALFGVVVAIVAGVLFGVGPELLRGTVDLAPSLRGTGSRGATRSHRGTRLLVGAQVALSVVLVVGAGLFLATLGRLHDEQRGFDAEGLATIRYSLGSERETYRSHDARVAFHEDFLARIEAIPGVTGAAITAVPPLGGQSMVAMVEAIDGVELPTGDRPSLGMHLVEGRSFDVLRTPVVAGRTFNRTESTTQVPVAVINRTAAETLFPDGDPIGRTVRAGATFGTEEKIPFEIVGVVEDVLYRSPTEGVGPDMYVSTGMLASWTPTVVVRTDGDPAEVISKARDLLAEIDPRIALWQTATGDQLRRSDVADTRLLVGVLVLFAALALLVSGAGLWAVVSQAVAERRREIGVRMALGAHAVSVEALVFRQGVLPIVLGAATGLIAALAIAPRVGSLLFGVGPRDPAIFAGATLVLTAVALLATWLPARRAARVDPVEVLGSE